jgi:WD40 repeat protein
VVSAFYDKTVRIWNATNGFELAVLHGHEDKVNSAAFSPDGRRAVSASDDKTVRIWDAANEATRQ